MLVLCLGNIENVFFYLAHGTLTDFHHSDLSIIQERELRGKKSQDKDETAS